MTTHYYFQRRKSLRLSCHDYSSASYYFVTICTANREHFFGEICDDRMMLSEIGKIVYQNWYELPKRFPDIELDEFVVMPNHIHGIIVKPFVIRETLNKIEGVGDVEKIQIHLSEIIRSYKAVCTKSINSIQEQCHFGWQRNYYDHVIRNETSLNKIREYIQYNPLNWKTDKNNLQNYV